MALPPARCRAPVTLNVRFCQLHEHLCPGCEEITTSMLVEVWPARPGLPEPACPPARPWHPPSHSGPPPPAQGPAPREFSPRITESRGNPRGPELPLVVPKREMPKFPRLRARLVAPRPKIDAPTIAVPFPSSQTFSDFPRLPHTGVGGPPFPSRLGL